MKRRTVSINQKFNSLTVLSFDKKGSHRRNFWLCLCICGNITSVSTNSLTSGTVKSCGCSRRIGGQNSFWNDKYSSYKRRALRKNITFSLNKKIFIELCIKNCFYCNSEPIESYRLYKGRKTTVLDQEYAKSYIVKANGIDRIDNKKGYTKNNSVTCCSKCNIMKFMLKETEFLSHIKKIYEHSIKDR